METPRENLSRGGLDNAYAPRRGGIASGCLGNVGGLQALGALGNLEFDLLALFQRPEAIATDRRVMHEHVLAVLLADEPEPLLRVEPLHMTNCHCVLPPFVLVTRHRGRGSATYNKAVT